MVNWKIALIVVIIAGLAMLIGVWFGYRYVTEQSGYAPAEQQERPARRDATLSIEAAESRRSDMSTGAFVSLCN